MKFILYCKILKFLGIKFSFIRLCLLLKNKSGYNKLFFKSRFWEDIKFSDISKQDHEFATEVKLLKEKFLFSLGTPPDIPERISKLSLRKPELQKRISALKNGRCTCFFNQISAKPTQWHKNFINGKQSDPDIPWFKIPDYVPEQGDPRTLWEPSRAAWAIDIARSQARGILTDGRKLLWEWVDSWMQDNPPFKGFQWKCGQESAVRFIAICFGFWSVESKETLTSERYTQFVRLAWATGYRIYHHIDYALSQKNNHSISEACGLLLIAHLFPCFKHVGKWRKKGRIVLEKELKKQIYEDGSYVQQSFNYQRVMMQGALLALRIAEIEDDPFPGEIYALLDTCVEFLYQMMDEETGLMPQYGHNDGAWILPLNNCDFWDFRPLLQSVHYLVHRERLFESGPWDENMLWLFGEKALDAPQVQRKKQISSKFDEGGYYTLRNKDSWAMMRCHTYRDRPYHADQLHLDLWYKGKNIFRDCGTYKYYIPENPGLENYFDSTVAHNVIRVDKTEPMEKASRFMKFPWPSSLLLRYDSTSSYQNLEGVFNGYNRPPWQVQVKRSVTALHSDVWLIIDDILGTGAHTWEQFLHLTDHDVRQTMEEISVCQINMDGDHVYFKFGTLKGSTPNRHFVRGMQQNGEVQGWVSDQYGTISATPVIVSESRGELPGRIYTVICFNDLALIEVQSRNIIRITYKLYEYNIYLNSLEDADSTIVDNIEISVKKPKKEGT